MTRPGLSLFIKAGLLTGLLDILAAFASFYLKTGKTPVLVLKFIASGLFGSAAFSGGAEMALYGLLLHFIIAFCFAAFFFLIMPRLFPSASNKFLTAVAYGAFIWLVMNLLIVPLSNTPKQSFHALDTALSMVILIVCIGLPLSFIYFNRIKPIK